MTGRRIFALLIDWVGAILIAQLLPGSGAYGTQSNSFTTLMIFALQVFLLTWTISSSFGQRIVGIKITNLDGQKPTFLQAFVRTFFILLVFPPLLADASGRGLHDRIAGTKINKL